MEIILGLILAILGLGVLWASITVIVAVMGFFVTVFATTLTAIAAFFTGRWIWRLVLKDYSEEDEADKT